MNFFDAIILGVVQGITEFLPVSSTGHLTLTSTLLSLPRTDFQSSFEIAIQVGSMIAVIALYAYKIIRSRTLWKKIAVAFLPSAIIGIIFYSYIKSFLGNPWIVISALFIGGIAFIIFDTPKQKVQEKSLEQFTYTEAFLIGCFQILALIPGVSRSGATVLGGISQKLPRKEVVEFSFLLALPTIFGATAFDSIKTSYNFSSHEWSLLLAGILVSGIISFVSMKWLISFVSTHTFRPFGVYRIIVAIIMTIVLLL